MTYEIPTRLQNILDRVEVQQTTEKDREILYLLAQRAVNLAFCDSTEQWAVIARTRALVHQLDG